MNPNLFIIGSMKSGTTYLYSLLDAHPDVFMSEPKEPSYFVEPGQLKRLWPWMWGHEYWRGLDRYLELFDPAGSAPVVGEASVYYTYRPHASGVPERLHRFNPQARLIYVMRDPIQRTISHYWHSVLHLGEHRPLAEAIDKDRQYTDVSHYAMQLAPYLERFGPERMKMITFEELTADPEGTVASILRWLDLDASAVPAPIPPKNVTPKTIGRSLGGLRRLRQQNSLVRLAADSLPAPLRHLGSRMVTREVNTDAVDTTEVVNRLRPLQQRQTEALTGLIGRRFPEWTTLDPARASSPATRAAG